MFQKDSTVMSVQTLINRTKKGQITFDNVVQRGYVWKKDIRRRSLFIHSLLSNFPVPPLYANKVGLIYDMLDGKQRSTTIVSFFNYEFSLSDDTPDTQKLCSTLYNDLKTPKGIKSITQIIVFYCGNLWISYYYLTH